MDSKEQLRFELDKISLYQLRVDARELGVHSSTVFSKPQLIEKMIEIMMGEAEPHIKTTKRGRPSLPLMDSARTKSIFQQAERARKERVANRLQNIEVAQAKSNEQAQEELVDEVLEIREGVLELYPDGYGFVRVRNCEPSDRDAYVSLQQVKRYGLRHGDVVKGSVKKLKENKYMAMTLILTVNGEDVENIAARPVFEELLTVFPNQRIKLETKNSKDSIAIRCIDLVSPIGKGQRGMIVAPPKTGKTTILKNIAQSISENNPEVHLMMLLIDERPEEVTDIQRSIKGEVIYSTFDETPEHHTRCAELTLAKAKRMVESGKDVVILLDSLTRLARAYNLTVNGSGRTLSGGIDPSSLYAPKRFFGSARALEKGGSLTIIATALVETGSRADEVIFEEFKGTGNMEIRLDRNLSEKRIFPAIDLNESSTRREDLLLSQDELEGMWAVRKLLSGGANQEAVEQLLSIMSRTENNAEFIAAIKNLAK